MHIQTISRAYVNEPEPENSRVDYKLTRSLTFSEEFTSRDTRRALTSSQNSSPVQISSKTLQDPTVSKGHSSSQEYMTCGSLSIHL